MKAITKTASIILLVSGLQGCVGITSYPDNHYVKSNSNPYGYFENHGNCCKNTDYYFYSNYSQPYFYGEVNLEPVDGCTYQSTSRYFYFAPQYGHWYSGCKMHHQHRMHHHKMHHHKHR